MPEGADLVVRIAEDADTAMRVVGDQVLNIAGAANGDFVVVSGGALTTRALSASDIPALTAYVPKSLYDANSILVATSDDTPVALTVGASTFVGRKASGGISAMSATEAAALLTDLVPKSLFDANTVLMATSDNTPIALTVGASTIVGRKATGDIVAMTGAEARVVTGAVGLTGDETIAGTKTFSGTVSSTDIIGFTVRRGTTDGADNSRVTIAGGGATGSDRGAQVIVRGNEDSSPGRLVLAGGQVANSGVTVQGYDTGLNFVTIATLFGDGVILGATGKTLGFYGAAGQTRAAAITKPAATAATNVAPYGYSQAQADAIVTAVNAIIDVLKNTNLSA